VLAAALAGLVLANVVTAFAPTVGVALASRFVAGAFSGTIWGMLAVHGRRISPPGSAGRALAIVSAGAPVGFAFGTPLGSWLGTALDSCSPWCPMRPRRPPRPRAASRSAGSSASPEWS
jgi:predicted MFS family arabinose efflux permease